MNIKTRTYITQHENNYIHLCLHTFELFVHAFKLSFDLWNSEYKDVYIHHKMSWKTIHIHWISNLHWPSSLSVWHQIGLWISLTPNPSLRPFGLVSSLHCPSVFAIFLISKMHQVFIIIVNYCVINANSS